MYKHLSQPLAIRLDTKIQQVHTGPQIKVFRALKACKPISTYQARPYNKTVMPRGVFTTCLHHPSSNSQMETNGFVTKNIALESAHILTRVPDGHDGGPQLFTNSTQGNSSLE